MNFLKLIVLLTFMVGITFTSCVKDNLDVTEVVDQDQIETINKTTNNLLTNIRSSGDDGLDLDCITILYTFEMVLEDGSEVSISSENDFWTLLIDSSNFIVDFVYPLNVLNADDEEVSVDDVIALGELFAACIPDTGWVNNYDLVPAFLLEDSCFELVFPVELQDQDENAYVASNLEEFIDLMCNQNILFFSWPLELTDEDGETLTVHSSEEFFQLLYTCEDYYVPGDSMYYGNDSIFWGFEFLGCYEIVFPISVIGVNGNEIEIENADAYMSLIFNGTFIQSFVFPLQLIDPQGNLVTANNDEELNQLISDCWGGPQVGNDFLLFVYSTAAMGEDACYSIQYPVTAEIWDSSYLQIISDEALLNLINTEPYFNFVYPITVIMVDDGTEVILYDPEDIFALIENCEM